MDIKKNLKLNYLLGNNYILFPTKDGWTLARSGSYRVVMSSEKNTEEELDKFVKEHREYNSLVIIRRFGLIANTIILGLCITNLFVHSEFLSHFNFGAIIVLLPMLLIVNYVGLNNRDVYKKVLDEDIAYYGKLMNDIKEKEKKSTRANKRKKSSEVQE